MWCAVGIGETGNKTLRMEDTRPHTRDGRYAERAGADDGCWATKSGHPPALMQSSCARNFDANVARA